MLRKRMCASPLLGALLWLVAVLSPALAQQRAAPVTALTFQEFFAPTANELRPSEKLLSLNGQRVSLVGFMAKMEAPPAGAFYLCPRPVFADESGGGNGDLPVNAVRVEAPALQGQSVAFVPQAFAVVGVLQVGPRVESDGTVSAIRLILDTSLDKSEGTRALRSDAPTKLNHHLKPTTKRRK